MATRPTRSGPSVARHLLALALFTALTLLYLRPPLADLDRRLAPDLGDTLFNLWVLKWGIHEFHLGLRGLWNAPIFFPAPWTLAYSDHLLGPAAVAAAFTAVVPSPIAAYNLLFLGSFALCGWSAWYVLSRSGLAAAPALFGAAAWAFSPYRWDHTPHLQLLLAAGVPLVLWLWDRLLAAPTWRRAALFLLIYAAHVSGGLYLAYMIHVPLAALLANRLPALRREGLDRGRVAVLATTAAVAAAVAAAFFLPYWLAWRGHGPPRSPEELRHWGASLVSYLTPTEPNLYSALWPPALRREENALFAGFLPTAFAAAGLAGLWRRQPRPERLPLARRLVLLGCGGIALAGWAMGELHTWSIRPGLEMLDRLVPGHSYKRPFVLLVAGTLAWLLLRRRWRGDWPRPLAGLDPWWRGLLLAGAACLLLAHPMVFQAAAQVLPGLGGMRAPARFHVYVSFATAALAAAGLARLLATRGSPAARRATATVVLALLAIELAPRPVRWPWLRPEKEFPPVYAWLAGRRDVAALVELPWTDPGAQHPEARDIHIMYFGTRHWKPLVNGYSGYFPEHYLWLRRRCCWPAPEGEALAALRHWGVTHVLIHQRRLSRRWQRRAIQTWERTAGVRPVYADGHDTVYAISPAIHSPPSPAAVVSSTPSWPPP